MVLGGWWEQSGKGALRCAALTARLNRTGNSVGPAFAGPLVLHDCTWQAREGKYGGERIWEEVRIEGPKEGRT